MPTCKGCDAEYSQSIFTSPSYCKRCLDEIEGDVSGTVDFVLCTAIGFCCLIFFSILVLMFKG